MPTVSINIAGFQKLVDGMEKLRRELPPDRGAVSGRLSHVMVTTQSLGPVDGVLAWADGQIMGLHRRLAMARAIEASTPGIQTYAVFDENAISSKSREQVAADAQLVADYLKKGGGIPKEVLDVLAANKNDPYFAQALAQRVDLRELAVTLQQEGQRGHPQAPLSPGMRPDDFDLQKWKQDYAALLDGLGQTLGLASRGTGDVAPPAGWTQQWIDGITADRKMPGQASVLAMVVSRGTWSTDFTVGLTKAIYDLETGDKGSRGMWQRDAYGGSYYSGALLPDGKRVFDPLALVLQAVARDPEAGIRLARSTGTTTVSFEGKDYQISSFVDYLLTRRRWPVDNGEAAGQALRTAITPYEGGDVADQLNLAEQVRVRSRAFEQEVADRAKDKPWWSDVGHLFLDVLGLVPVIGEPIDGVNAAWYYAEGDIVNGSLTVVAMVPVAGWAGTGTKWGTKVLKGADAAKFLDSVGGKVLKRGTADEAVTVARAADLPKNVDIPTLKFTDQKAFNEAANKAHPNAKYEYNGVAWSTDDLGRTRLVEGSVKLDSSAKRSSLQTEIGKEGFDTDVGFHLWAHQFGGPVNRLNVVPGNGKRLPDGTKNLNQSEYGKMERTMKGWINDPDVVDVHLQVQPTYFSGNTSARPDWFTVVSKTTTKDGHVIETVWEFENRS